MNFGASLRNFMMSSFSSSRCVERNCRARAGPRPVLPERPQPARELGALRIAPRQRNLVIDENEGQRVLPGTVQEALDSSVVDKGHRLLAQVEPLDPGPCCLAHSRSAAKVTNCWSTSTPHTPVLQHMAGSKTLISDYAWLSPLGKRLSSIDDDYGRA